ncbi:MAG: DUF4430 domain-containing protein [Promethearchaeota archaeon]
MIKIEKTIILIGSLILIQLLYQSSVPIVKAENNIPNSYYQELNLEDTYFYEVLGYGGAAGWYNFTPWPGNSYEGKWNTSIGGQIIINFSGFHDKDPNDWGNIFDDPIPWFDISILNNNTGVLKTNFTLDNRSNSEIARALTLGYNSFQPGFLIPSNNLTTVKELAINQSDPGGLWDILGEVNVKETNDLLYISFDQVGGDQKTYLVYDTLRGFLIWAKTSIGGYLLEIKSLNFIFDYSMPQKENALIQFLPYLLIISISLISIVSSLILAKVNDKFRKFNKYVLIAIIGIASITSFLIFTSSLGVTEVNKPQKEVKDITLIVDYGNGTIKTQENFQLINYNTTVFDALIKWCKVEYHDYGDMGILIESIDGVSGNWLYSVNDDFPGISSDMYNIKNGDTIKWIFS